jgi:hypothetical protein
LTTDEQESEIRIDMKAERHRLGYASTAIGAAAILSLSAFAQMGDAGAIYHAGDEPQQRLNTGIIDISVNADR